ncbi:plasmid mobilization relaxosome protein MobC [Nonlabens ponticola]|uniref:Plasmid mobilization relaxosome protein MobC n=1 Tax=Nonlabens ponticola TaxID=2496866 RepID=A0A3S9N0A7_9FLAO|nr:plasmid mobilization relaxosome protein MobC [Nonlabens ponticola]AZQ44847.1 plasmid mobilization relaxosome protein MobC [Nonlabens ponticola]
MAKKKGGRPEIDNPDMKRDHQINLYLTKIEKDFVIKYCEMYSMKTQYDGRFIRRFLLDCMKNKKLNVTQMIAPYQQVELHRIGINLNQLMKKLNALNYLSGIEKQKLDDLLDELTRILID